MAKAPSKELQAKARQRLAEAANRGKTMSDPTEGLNRALKIRNITREMAAEAVTTQKKKKDDEGFNPIDSVGDVLGTAVKAPLWALDKTAPVMLSTLKEFDDFRTNLNPQTATSAASLSQWWEQAFGERRLGAKDYYQQTAGINNPYLNVFTEVGIDLSNLLFGAGALSKGAKAASLAVRSESNVIKVARAAAAAAGRNIDDEAKIVGHITKTDDYIKAATEANEIGHRILRKGTASLSRRESIKWIGETGGAKILGKWTVIPQEITHLLTRPTTQGLRALRNAPGLGKALDNLAGKYGPTLVRAIRSKIEKVSLNALDALNIIGQSAAKEGATVNNARNVWTKLTRKSTVDDLFQVRDVIQGRGTVDALSSRQRLVHDFMKKTFEDLENAARAVGVQLGHIDEYIPWIFSDEMLQWAAANGSATLRGRAAKAFGRPMAGFQQSRMKSGDVFLGKTLPPEYDQLGSMAEREDFLNSIAQEVMGDDAKVLFNTDLSQVFPAAVQAMARVIRNAEIEQAMRKGGIIVEEAVQQTVHRGGATKAQKLGQKLSAARMRVRRHSKVVDEISDILAKNRAKAAAASATPPSPPGTPAAEALEVSFDQAVGDANYLLASLGIGPMPIVTVPETAIPFDSEVIQQVVRDTAEQVEKQERQLTDEVYEIANNDNFTEEEIVEQITEREAQIKTTQSKAGRGKQKHDKQRVKEQAEAAGLDPAKLTTEQKAAFKEQSDNEWRETHPEWLTSSEVKSAKRKRSLTADRSAAARAAAGAMAPEEAERLAKLEMRAAELMDENPWADGTWAANRADDLLWHAENSDTVDHTSELLYNYDKSAEGKHLFDSEKTTAKNKIIRDEKLRVTYAKHAAKYPPQDLTDHSSEIMEYVLRKHYEGKEITPELADLDNRIALSKELLENSEDEDEIARLNDFLDRAEERRKEILIEGLSEKDIEKVTEQIEVRLLAEEKRIAKAEAATAQEGEEALEHHLSPQGREDAAVRRAEALHRRYEGRTRVVGAGGQKPLKLSQSDHLRRYIQDQNKLRMAATRRNLLPHEVARKQQINDELIALGQQAEEVTAPIVDDTIDYTDKQLAVLMVEAENVKEVLEGLITQEDELRRQLARFAQIERGIPLSEAERVQLTTAWEQITRPRVPDVRLPNPKALDPRKRPHRHIENELERAASRLVGRESKRGAPMRWSYEHAEYTAHVEARHVEISNAMNELGIPAEERVQIWSAVLKAELLDAQKRYSAITGVSMVQLPDGTVVFHQLDPYAEGLKSAAVPNPRDVTKFDLVAESTVQVPRQTSEVTTSKMTAAQIAEMQGKRTPAQKALDPKVGTKKHMAAQAEKVATKPTTKTNVIMKKLEGGEATRAVATVPDNSLHVVEAARVKLVDDTRQVKMKEIRTRNASRKPTEKQLAEIDAAVDVERQRRTNEILKSRTPKPLTIAEKKEIDKQVAHIANPNGRVLEREKKHRSLLKSRTPKPLTIAEKKNIERVLMTHRKNLMDRLKDRTRMQDITPAQLEKIEQDLAKLVPSPKQISAAAKSNLWQANVTRLATTELDDMTSREVSRLRDWVAGLTEDERAAFQADLHKARALGVRSNEEAGVEIPLDLRKAVPESNMGISAAEEGYVPINMGVAPNAFNQRAMIESLEEDFRRIAEAANRFAGKKLEITVVGTVEEELALALQRAQQVARETETARFLASKKGDNLHLTAQEQEAVNLVAESVTLSEQQIREVHSRRTIHFVTDRGQEGTYSSTVSNLHPDSPEATDFKAQLEEALARRKEATENYDRVKGGADVQQLRKAREAMQQAEDDVIALNPSQTLIHVGDEPTIEDVVKEGWSHRRTGRRVKERENAVANAYNATKKELQKLESDVFNANKELEALKAEMEGDLHARTSALAPANKKAAAAESKLARYKKSKRYRDTLTAHETAEKELTAFKRTKKYKEWAKAEEELKTSVAAWRKKTADYTPAVGTYDEPTTSVTTWQDAEVRTFGDGRTFLVDGTPLNGHMDVTDEAVVGVLSSVESAKIAAESIRNAAEQVKDAQHIGEGLRAQVGRRQRVPISPPQRKPLALGSGKSQLALGPGEPTIPAWTLDINGQPLPAPPARKAIPMPVRSSAIPMPPVSTPEQTAINDLIAALDLDQSSGIPLHDDFFRAAVLRYPSQYPHEVVESIVQWEAAAVRARAILNAAYPDGDWYNDDLQRLIQQVNKPTIGVDDPSGVAPLLGNDPMLKILDLGNPSVIDDLTKNPKQLINKYIEALRMGDDELARAYRDILDGVDLGKSAIKHLENQAKRSVDEMTKAGVNEQEAYDALIDLPAEKAEEMEDAVLGAVAVGMRGLLANPKVTIPEDVAEALAVMAKIYEPGAFQRFLRETFDPIVTWIKAAQVTYPGFHVTNLLGNVFNNFLAGVSPSSYVLLRRLNKVNAERYHNSGKVGGALWNALSESEQDLARKLYDYELGTGVYSTQFLWGDDVASRASSNPLVKGRAAYRKVAKWNPVGAHGPVVRGSRAVGHLVDNFGRSALYLDTLVNGKSVDEALALVEKFHFNYADLSDVERQIKRFVPFYTWTRHNLPLQIHMLALQPGKFHMWDSARRAIEGQSEANEELPEWFTSGVHGHIRTPLKFGGGHVYLADRTPMSDLNILTNPTSRLAGMVSPFPRVFFERLIGKKLYSGHGFNDYTPVIAPNVYSQIPGLMELFEKLGRAEFVDGEWVMSDRDVYTMDSFVAPMARARRLLPSEEKYSRGVVNAVVAATIGGWVATNTLEQQQAQLDSETLDEAYDIIDKKGTVHVKDGEVTVEKKSGQKTREAYKTIKRGREGRGPLVGTTFGSTNQSDLMKTYRRMLKTG